MARPLRVEFPDAVYHITVRGNRRGKIFLDDTDRLLFLKTFFETIKSANWICYAYCLMDNHFHLAIETPDGNLSKGMRDLNGIYTQRFNKRNGTVGHLFQGRFKAFLIEKETYLLDVIRYIVLNPVRAGMVRDPKDWKWSSHRSTIGIENKPQWLATDFVLGLFSKTRSKSLAEYERFVLDGVELNSPFEQVGKGAILGSEQFVHDVWEQFSQKEDITEIPRAQRIIGRPSLEDIFFDIEGKDERNKAIGFARFRCGYSASEIARWLKISPATVSIVARNIQ